MASIVIAVHVVVCVALVVAVLLQQGKGADIGAVFGGSSQTVFGSAGAGNLLTKVTSGLAVVFFATSIFLAYASTRRATGSLLEGSSPKSVMPSVPVTLPPVKNLPGSAPAQAPAPKK